MNLEGVNKNWLRDNYPEYEELLKEMSKVELTPTEPYKLNLKVVNKSDNENPKYESAEASGFDLRANLTESVTLKTLKRQIIPTGLFFDLPKGFEIQVRPRSGLAAKHGITVLNTPGTVDSDYTGEIKVILVNLSNDEFTVNHGDRIAQAVISSVTNSNIFNFNFVDKIEKITDRGESGFGSTGIQ